MKKVIYLLILNLFFFNLKAQEASFQFKEGETYLNLNGIDHWVKIKGIANNTVPIVVLHGGPGGFNYNFEQTIGPLLEKFATIVYYEQRGCGRSHAAKDSNDYELPVLIDDLDKLIEKLGQGKVVLLGYSFGAELALRYTVKHPEKVEKLILSSPAELSTFTKLTQIQGFYSIGNTEFRRDVEKILESGSSINEKFFKIWDLAPTSLVDSFLFVNQKAAEENRRLWQESNLPCEGSGHFSRVIFENSKGDLLKTVSGLAIPALIISGIHDKNGGFHYGKDLNRILPNSELILYINSAHFPDMEESEKFSKDVKDFIM